MIALTLADNVLPIFQELNSYFSNLLVFVAVVLFNLIFLEIILGIFAVDF